MTTGEGFSGRVFAPSPDEREVAQGVRVAQGLRIGSTDEEGCTEKAHSVEVKERRAALLKGGYSVEDVEELAILPPSEGEGTSR